MPKYQVLRPIEHDQVLYLPAFSRERDTAGRPPIALAPEGAPTTVKSVSHGRDVPVDSSGVIELTLEEAARIDMGQVEKIEEPSFSRTRDTAGGAEPKKKAEKK